MPLPGRIATSSDERELIRLGGRVGSTLYRLSREGAQQRPAPVSGYGQRRPITLSTKPLSFAPIGSEFDDDNFQPSAVA